MQLHELKRVHPNRRAKRVGRGGTRGKTSGRGHKGQKARASGSPRPEIRDIIKKIPKRRGYGSNRARTVNDSRVRPAVVNLRDLDRVFADGDAITPATLKEKGLVATSRGKLPQVKILGTGAFTKKKCTLSGCLISDSARKKLADSGLTIAE